MTTIEIPFTTVRSVVARALAEDLGGRGDVTGQATIPADAVARFALRARRPGVLAGRAAAAETFAQVDPCIDADWQLADGATLAGRLHRHAFRAGSRSILTAERTALNFLGRLSGIATLTRAYVDAVVRHSGAHRPHPEDHARPARAGTGRGRCRRRRGAPLRAGRRHPDQGQPRGRVRRRRRGASASPRFRRAHDPHLRSRSTGWISSMKPSRPAPKASCWTISRSKMRAAASVQRGCMDVVLEASGGVSLEDGSRHRRNRRSRHFGRRHHPLGAQPGPGPGRIGLSSKPDRQRSGDTSREGAKTRRKANRNGSNRAKCNQRRDQSGLR